jgi:hypothetical protein
MSKKRFDYYLSKAIERKLKGKAEELGISFSVNYKSNTDTSHITISGNSSNFKEFANFASDLILDQDLSRTVKYKYV